MVSSRKYDLEDRLINFAINCSNVVVAMPSSKLANHIGGQLTRASASSALNYGETQAAESPADFIHKLKVVLKEIRESRVCLKIILQKPLLPANDVHFNIN